MKKILIAVAVAVVAIIVVVNIGGCKKDCVWRDNIVTAHFPKDAIKEKVSKSSPKAEIYIDGSVSMKPYFNASHPEDMVNTISDIWNLNSTGTSIYFQGTPQPYGGMIANIITNLKQQPYLPESPFYDFFREQVGKIDTTNTLVYLVTDGIISDTSKGGNKNANLNMTLRLQQIGGMIRDALKGHSDLAGAILRYEGKYEGDYWNMINQRITAVQCPSLKGEITRPYYVIVLGKKADVRWLQSLSADKLNNPRGRLFMGVHDLDGHKKARSDEEDTLAIEDMSKDVILILELPECLKEIKGEDVMVTNDGKELKNVKVTKESGNKLQAMIDPVLKSDDDGYITVSFVMKDELKSDCEWLSEWSTDDDEKGPDDSTTFGLSTLVRGMFDGLEGEGKDYLKFDFVYKLPE